MLAAHRVVAILVLVACASGALWGGLLYWRGRGAGPVTAHLLSIAQTLLVAQVGLGLLLLSGLYALLWATGEWWWIWATVGWLLVSLVLGQLLPVIILPLFYKEPEKFALVMRSAIALNGSFFNTQRMLSQYVRNAYAPIYASSTEPLA